MTRVLAAVGALAAAYLLTRDNPPDVLVWASAGLMVPYLAGLDLLGVRHGSTHD